MDMPLLKYLLFLFFLVCVPSCANVRPDYVCIKDQDTVYDSVIIEIQPTEKCDVHSDSIKALIDCLDRYSIVDRDNVKIVRRTRIMTARDSWPSDKIKNLVVRHRRIFDLKDDRNLRLFMLFLPGNYNSVNDDRDSVAAFHRGRGEIVVFRNRTALGNTEVLLHEIGHALGLVDRDHRDGSPINEKRPQHCNNKKCTMFWIVNTTELCELCVRDISKLIPRNSR